LVLETEDKQGRGSMLTPILLYVYPSEICC